MDDQQHNSFHNRPQAYMDKGRPQSSGAPRLASQSVRIQRVASRRRQQSKAQGYDAGRREYSPDNVYSQLSPDASINKMNNQNSSKKKLRKARPMTAVPNFHDRKQSHHGLLHSQAKTKNSLANLDSQTPKKEGKHLRKRPMTAYKLPQDSIANQSLDNMSGTEGTNTVNILLQERGIKKDKRAISEYTYCENQEVFDVIKKLEDIQKFQAEKSEPYKNIEKVNCRELLQQANRDIKTINYQLQRVIASEEFYHSVIQQRRNTDIEVLEQSYMYFKINIKNQLSPMKLSCFIKENDQIKGRKQDLRMFFSMTNKEPNENDNYKQAINPEKPVIVSSFNKEKFTQDWCYITFFSLTGCSISVTLNLPEEILKTKKRIGEEETGYTNQHHNDAYEQERDPYQEIKDKWNRITGDFLTQNIKQISKWDQTQEDKKTKNRQSIDRVVVAKHRQKSIEMNNLKMKYFLVHRWDIIKEKRRQYEVIISKLQKERNFKRKWARHINTFQVLQHIYGAFAKRKEEIYTMKRMEYSVNTMAKVFSRYCQRLGKNKKERLQIRSRDVFAFSTQMMMDVSEGRARGFMKVFLKETAEKYNLKMKLITFHQKVMQLQSGYRNRVQALENRCEVLGELWEREKVQLVKECLMKKTKKRQTLMKKLNVMTNEVKQAVIKAYLQRCKLKYAAVFAEWRLHTHYKNTLNPKERESYVLRVIRKKDRLFAQESLLFGGIDFDDDTQVQTQAQAQSQAAQQIALPQNSNKPNPRGAQPRASTKSPVKPSNIQSKQTPAKQPVKTVAQPKPVANIERILNISEEPPIFRFIPRKDLIRKLIIRATSIANVKELKF